MTLKGYFLNTCMSMKEIQVVEKSPRLFEVLPIAEMKPGACLQVLVPFTEVVQLRSKFSMSGKALVHARSLNGQSQNKAFDYKD